MKCMNPLFDCHLTLNKLDAPHQIIKIVLSHESIPKGIKETYMHNIVLQHCSAKCLQLHYSQCTAYYLLIRVLSVLDGELQVDTGSD